MENIRLILIDFTKPWWRIIVNQKWLALIVLFSVILRDVFWATVPFLIAFVLENSSWNFFIAACVLWSLIELNVIFLSPLNIRFQLQCIHSVFYSAHQYLLTIDPQYHIKRSSGVILAKIDRAARGYEEILDQVTYEFAPLIIGVITMVVVLSQYSIMLTCAVSGCLMAMVGYGYYFARYACQEKETAFIQTDDDFKAVSFENLAQVQLIRATFATDYMKDRLTHKIDINSTVEKGLWMLYTTTAIILSMIYTLSILLLLGFFVYRIKNNLTSLPFAIGVILAYIQSTKQLITILKPLRRYMRGFAAITDLFEFMPDFGKQTIPVFTTQDRMVEKKKNNVLIAQNLLFGYDGARLFNNHTLLVETRVDQQYKLYGIIGPSGVGKTTLLSILGGQLKPLAGSVFINDIDIYAVGDSERRQLIALQGQIATSIKGSVRYNLLFGLPENHEYSDEYLFDVLRRVGLENALREHQGLDTLLGEGALNISGGQRQRLNFAGLYLRACYYKPILILIDEPTSSLDEISELAVTAMIRELASFAITLLIAHRLKTLKDAAGLIDLSLIVETKNIQVYAADQLEKYSPYYRRLLEGKDTI